MYKLVSVNDIFLIVKNRYKYLLGDICIFDRRKRSDKKFFFSKINNSAIL
jgi:hypothetical protein